ncbi:MAG: YicC family protein [Rikenellaceae bacterium]|nr:YicC family protein [Rikenellaceae bacterium]
MTGFGKAEVSLPNKKITVEIRSLNSKQLDLNLRLPAIYRQAEYDIRSTIGKAVVRGKVDVFVSVETNAVNTSATINSEVFAEYSRQLRDAMSATQMDPNFITSSIASSIVAQSILRLPDVVASEIQSTPEEELVALHSAIAAALEQFDAFRRQEGAVLISDLLYRVEKIENYKQEVTPFEKARTETIRARILDTLNQLNVEVDHNRLEQEMIFYFEKLDITEEKVRLTNHCNYFREVAASEDNAGRKLGFIAQEMGREINTMGSKANESNIQVLVVKMKDELEKIKEQVLNIL